MLSSHDVGTYQRNKTTHNSSGNAHPQSSQLTEPLWSNPCLRSGNGAAELNSTLKTKKAWV